MGDAERFAIVLACASVLAASACSLFTSFGDLTGSASDAASPDGWSASDAAADAAGVTDGASDAGADVYNYIPNGTFETGCSGWTSYGGTLVADPRAHTGQSACLVCKSNGTNALTIDEWPGFAPDPKPGETYRFSAWVRSPTAVGANSRALIPWIRTYETDGGQVEQTRGLSGAYAESWVQISVQLPVATAAGWVNVYVALDGAMDGDCFLVDDAVLTKL